MALDDEKNNPLFRLPLLEIGIAPTEPLKKVFHLSKVSIQSPELNVVRNQAGVLNIESRFPRVEERIGEIKKGETAPTTVDADEIELRGGKVFFSDLSRKTPFKTVLSPIELKVDHFSNQKEKKTAYALSITSEARENINLQGELSLEPLSAEGGLEIKSVPLKKYSPYYQDQILFNLEEGRLDFSTRYKYAKGEKEPEILLSDLSVILNALRLKRQDEKEDFLKIPILSVKDTEVDVTKRKLTVGSLSTEKGRLAPQPIQEWGIWIFRSSFLLPLPPIKEEPKKLGTGKEEGKEMDCGPEEAFPRSVHGQDGRPGAFGAHQLHRGKDHGPGREHLDGEKCQRESVSLALARPNHDALDKEQREPRSSERSTGLWS